jgi:hypothetical protein
MPGRFDEVMSRHTDEELVAIASSVDEDYVAEAMAAANREITKRGLSPVALRVTKEKVEADTADKHKRADEPLESRKATTTFFLSMFGILPGLLFMATSTNLAREGYARKAREQRKYAVFGIGTFFALLFAIGIGVHSCR